MQKREAAQSRVWFRGSPNLSQVARHVWKGFQENELLTRSAALSYYFMFALFPMLFSLVAVVGLSARDEEARAALVKQFGAIMPTSAFVLVEKTVREISVHSSRWKLALGLVVAWWSGAGGMSAIMDALNRSYGATETRPYWKRLLLSLGLTASMSLLSVTALGVFLTGGDVARLIGERTGLSHATIVVWQYIEWPIALVFVLLALSLIYNLGPNLHRPWRWTTAGSLVAVLGWVVASFIFRVYLQNFGAYGRSYGSLGAVMVLLLWLYMSGLAILLGAEIDAATEVAQGPGPQLVK